MTTSEPSTPLEEAKGPFRVKGRAVRDPTLADALAELREDAVARPSMRQKKAALILAALEASPSPGVGWSVPDGWKIVPLEPTDEMLHNTVDERGTMRILEFTTPEERSMGFFIPRYDWRAMIAAAPLPPPPVQGAEP